MSEFIEREAALRVLCDACGNAACPKSLIPRCSYYEKMQSIPAADVRPVVRGKWLPKSEIGDCCYQCSGCGFVRDAYILDIGNFCPNCGAGMRAEPPKEE